MFQLALSSYLLFFGGYTFTFFLLDYFALLFIFLTSLIVYLSFLFLYSEEKVTKLAVFYILVEICLICFLVVHIF